MMAAIILIEVPRTGESILTLNDLSEADQNALSRLLSPYAGRIAKIRIGINRNRLSTEQREANAQARASRRVAREKVAAGKAIIELEKAEKRAKKAQEKLEGLQAKATPKKVKKSHHKSSQ